MRHAAPDPGEGLARRNEGSETRTGGAVIIPAEP
jgi:hypothetical protein